MLHNSCPNILLGNPSKCYFDMRLSALAALEKESRDELQEKLKLIEELESILQNEKLLSIIKELEYKRQIWKAKKNQNLKQEMDSFQAEDLIPNETVVVTLTEGNYIKGQGQIPIKARQGGKGIIGITPKEKDQLSDGNCQYPRYNLFPIDRGKVFFQGI